MEHKDYKKICQDCLPLVKRTGEFIIEHLFQVQNDDVETKDLNSLVSYVDKEAEVQLVAGLKKIIPDAGFITEENTIVQESKEATWIIDPLDGTNNFLHRIPHFAISLALIVDSEIVVGIVQNVYSRETFFSWKGGGAFLNDQKIQVSTTKNLTNAIIATGFPYKVESIEPIIGTLSHLIRNARGVRRFGAAALDLAYVACGRFDAYYETSINAWDIAGGVLLVTEAGGSVGDYDSGTEYLSKGNIIASTPALYPELCTIIDDNF